MSRLIPASLLLLLLTSAGVAHPTNRLSRLVQERKELDATVWRSEAEAQRHEQLIIRFWDDLRRRPLHRVLADAVFRSVILGKPGTEERVAGFSRRPCGDPFRTLDATRFRKQVQAWLVEGWRLEQSEWHHATFTPARSEFDCAFHLTGPKGQRVVVSGPLGIQWKNGQVDEVDASRLTLLIHHAKPWFEEWMTIDPRVEFPNSPPRVQPLLVYDLAGDGWNDIVLPGINRLYRNRGGRFEPEPLCAHPLDPAECGLIADINRDGFPDLLVVHVDRKLYCFEGRAGGTFPEPARKLFDEEIELPQALTAGDLDADGDLDLFIGQYEPPYVQGKMPTPYYDANDGRPAYLLRNDAGVFTDVTREAGLGAKRHRRSFSASFVDLDDDRDLDLLVVSDFSGMDVHLNDGSGSFRDGNGLLEARHGFGMSHTFDDFDGDGRLDLYMVGMSSTTARRLERLGLGRKGFEEHDAKRMAMTYGNRLLLGGSQGYRAAPFAGDAARLGWAWGCSSFDADNDGDRDLYVANGHMSGRSAQDYCTRYWTHDIYQGGKQPDPELFQLFGAEMAPTHGMRTSWNGYEKNALLLNLDHQGFLNAGFPLGVGFEFDSRAVVAADLDNDGLAELLLTRNWRRANGTSGTMLYVMKNRCPSGNRWIGVRLHPRDGRSPIGCQVELSTNQGLRTLRMVNGDSYSAQHPPVALFGLGKSATVASLQLVRPDGTRETIAIDGVNRYYGPTASR